MEIYTGARNDATHLGRMPVWGCPTYVLDPRLQDGKKIPKWKPRTRMGQFLGYSPDHSTTIGLIRNLTTGKVTPQYHCVYDHKFQTVLGSTDSVFDASSWNELCVSGLERHIDEEEDPANIPPLHPDWGPTDLETTSSSQEEGSQV